MKDALDGECVVRNEHSYFLVVLGAFAKFQKATINFVVSVCPSVRLCVCPHGRLGSTGHIYMLFDIFRIFFLKPFEKIQV
jgi:hypothetical protein